MIKCANCKGHHANVAEVRDCCGVGTVLTKPAATVLPSQAAPVAASGATEKQVAFIATLANERDIPATGGPFGRGLSIVVEGPKTKQEASSIIEWLLSLPKQPGLATEAKVVLPAVPEGHYAVASATGNNDLDFFRVDAPTEGKWAGRTFVKRVIGGKPDAPVRGATAKAALEAILAVGVEAAAIRYGVEIGRCYRCNRHLTDAVSRGLGIGPDCRAKG